MLLGPGFKTYVASSCVFPMGLSCDVRKQNWGLRKTVWVEEPAQRAARKAATRAPVAQLAHSWKGCQEGLREGQEAGTCYADAGPRCFLSYLGSCHELYPVVWKAGNTLWEWATVWSWAHTGPRGWHPNSTRHDLGTLRVSTKGHTPNQVTDGTVNTEEGLLTL